MSGPEVNVSGQLPALSLRSVPCFIEPTWRVEIALPLRRYNTGRRLVFPSEATASWRGHEGRYGERDTDEVSPTVPLLKNQAGCG